MHTSSPLPAPPPASSPVDAPSTWAPRASRDALTIACILSDETYGPELSAPDLHAAASAALAALVLDDLARAAGHTAADIADLHLALAALLDEAALRRGGLIAAAWSERGLLQQRHVAEAMTSAGDRFFERLAELLAAPPPSPARRGVLRVFALALACGLRGRHDDLADAPPLLALRARLHAVLAPARPIAAAPSREPPLTAAPPVALTSSSGTSSPLTTPPIPLLALPAPSSRASPLPLLLALLALAYLTAALLTRHAADEVALARLAVSLAPSPPPPAEPLDPPAPPAALPSR